MDAVHLIQMDSGDHLALPILQVPDRWKPYLEKIDEAITTLSRKERAPEEEPLPPHVKPSELLDSELFSFCNGDDLVMTKIANRSTELLLTHVFLADYFEGWTYTDETEANSPENVVRRKRIEYLEMLEREGRLPHEGTMELLTLNQNLR
jgi:hypothetical protein